MNKFLRYTVSFCAAALSLAACQKEEEFKPGEPDVDGCYGVYFAETSIDEVFDPEETTKAVEITVLRTVSDGEINFPLAVETDAAGIFTVSEVKFDDGAAETKVMVTMGENAEIGKTYTVSVTIDDPQYASKYSVRPTSATISLLIDKWNDLGKATFSHYFFEESYEVTVEQNDLEKNRFRLVSPLAEALEKEGPSFVAGGWAINGTGPDYLSFTLLEKGETLTDYSGNEFTITKGNLVIFDSYFTGFLYGGTGKINAWYPLDLYSECTEDDIAYSKVVAYQDNGLPGAVQFAPYFYISGVGGWNKTATDGAVTIVFPGYTYADYSIDVTAYDSEEGVLPVEFEIGADVAGVKYAVFESELSKKVCEQKVEEIEDGTAENIVTLTAEELETAEYVQNLTLEATGKYTIVAVSCDADGEVQEYTYASFGYIANGDDTSHPIVLTRSLLPESPTSLRYVLFGSGVTKLKVQTFTKEFYESKYGSYVYSYTYSDDYTEAFSDADLAAVNGSGFNGTVKEYLDPYEEETAELEADTEYVVVIYVENGYRSDFYVLDAKTPAE